MASNRVYYAVHRAAICPCGALGANLTSLTTAGFASSLIQSVGVTTSLEYEQLFELGRLQIFENVEGLPSIEITLERAIGVYPGADSTTIDAFTAQGTLWDICSRNGSTTDVTTAGSRQFNVNMITADENSTAKVGSVSATGMYLSNYSLNIAVEGVATESVTLVGNNCEWGSGLARMPSKGSYQNTVLANDAYPDSTASGIIQRKHVTGGTIPTGGLQSLSFSISFDREDLLQLGSKYPYYKAAGFPIETTLELEYIADKNSEGFDFSDGSKAKCNIGGTIANASIKAGNRTFTFGNMDWTGTSQSGGDAGGGNKTQTDSYVGYNYYTVSTNTDWTTTMDAVGCTNNNY